MILPSSDPCPFFTQLRALWLLWLGALSGLLIMPLGAVWAQDGQAALQRELGRWVVRGGVMVGPAGGGEGKPALAYKPGAHVPASIIKLATALAVLHLRGADYRFRTAFYVDALRNLIVRGQGDPMLISEAWAKIAMELRAAGVFVSPLHDLVLDTSAFPGELRVDGAGDSDNPYDARLGALVSNFNTVFLRVSADGAVHSAEAHTPLTPLALRLAAELPVGQHRINLSRRSGDSLRYTGELAWAFLRREGATFSGKITSGVLPAGLEPVWVHRSAYPLQEVVRGMLAHSNNYIANQLVINLAPSGQKELKAGMARLNRFLRERVGLSQEDFSLVEGSGLSPRNRIRLSAMLKIVERFRPWRHLLRRYGHSQKAFLAKTGTLSGVHTLAGFLPPQSGERAFVIMLNQPRNTRWRIYRRIAAHFLSHAP